MGTAASKPKIVVGHAHVLNTNMMMLSDSDDNDNDTLDSLAPSTNSNDKIFTASVVEKPKVVRRTHDRRSCYAEVDAGVPPPVPPHNVFNPKVRPRPNYTPPSPQSGVETMTTEIYTRKSCYGRRKSISSSKSASDSSGFTLSPKESSSEPSTPESLQFALDGYSEHTKLRVVNSDDEDEAPSTIHSAPIRKAAGYIESDSIRTSSSPNDKQCRQRVPSKALLAEQAEKRRVMTRRYSRYGHTPPKNALPPNVHVNE